MSPVTEDNAPEFMTRLLMVLLVVGAVIAPDDKVPLVDIAMFVARSPPTMVPSEIIPEVTLLAPIVVEIAVVPVPDMSPESVIL